VEFITNHRTNEYIDLQTPEDNEMKVYGHFGQQVGVALLLKARTSAVLQQANY